MLTLMIALFASAVPAAAAPRPNRAEVMAAVRAEWPHYDVGNKGHLTPLEFSTWVMRSHGETVASQARAGAIGAVSAMNASSTAFARADANHDNQITPEEMTAFLLSPPHPTAVQKLRASTRPAVQARP